MGEGWPYELARVLSYADLESFEKGIAEFGN